MRLVLMLLALLVLMPGTADARRWYELTVGGHRIYTKQGNPEFALAVSRAIAATAGPIAARYGYDPADTTVWVLHDVPWSNGAAYTLSNRIVLYGTTDNFALRGLAPWVRNVVAHEYAHLATLSLARRTPRWLGGIVLGGVREFTGDNRLTTTNVGASTLIPTERVPRWFSEGIAQFDSELEAGDSWDTTRQMLQRAAWLDNGLMSLDEMGSVSGKTYFEGEQVYNQGYSLIRYLGATYGVGSLRRLLENESNQTILSFERTLESTYGVPATQLESAWHESITREVAVALAALGQTAPAGVTWHQNGPFVSHAVLAPDGQRIAFFADGKSDYPRSRLVIAPLTAPTAGTAMTSRLAERPSWSPDGRFLVAAKTRRLGFNRESAHDLLKIDARDGDTDWLTRGAGLRWPAVHPAGQTVAVAAKGPGTWELATFNLKTSATTTLTSLPWGWQMRSLVFDPRGQLWVSLIHDGEVDLAQVSLTRPTELTILNWPGSAEREPQFDPAGNLWFSSDAEGSFQLYSLDTGSGMIRRHSSDPYGVIAAAPAITNVIATVYRHHRFSLHQLPISGPTYGDELAATWRVLPVPPPGDAAAAARSLEFKPARFRLGRPLVYPEFQYLFGEPLAGAVVVLQDEMGHHSLELEGLFGRSADVNFEYNYDGFYPRLSLTGRRFWGDIDIGVDVPFVWDSIDAEISYSPDNAWYIALGLDFNRIEWQDDLELFQVGGPFVRFQRFGGSALAQWADTPGRILNDIDPRGTVLLLSTALSGSRTKDLVGDTVGSLFLDERKYTFGRLLGNVFWGSGHKWFTGELNLRVGWITRDVDRIDKFFLGGSIFSLRRGEVRTYNNLPGYADFAISGEKMLFARAAARAMLATKLGSAGPFLFEALLLELALEGGNAWPNGQRFGDIFADWFAGDFVADGPRPFFGVAENDPRFSGLLFDTALDLKLKTILYDKYPWNSFIRVAHGFQDGVYSAALDAFNQPWTVPLRVYIGIGTGF